MTLAGARCAVYARYSSDRQSESSIEAQVARCRRFAAERGGAIVDELVFADYAISGATTARPGLQALMAAAAAARVDVLLVEDLSRLSRDQADAHPMLRKLRVAGVRVIGVADGVDTSERGSKLLVGVRTLLADAYLDDLRDKTRRGMEARARAGLATGGITYGYRHVARAEGGKAIEIDRDQADVVRRIFRAHAGGKSFAAIAAELNAARVAPPRSSRRTREASWQHTTIRSILRNTRYRGVLTFGERDWKKDPETGVRRCVLRSPHEVLRLERPDLRIVDEDTWDAVHAEDRQLSAKRRRSSAARSSFVLSGLLQCGVCGAGMVIHGGGGDRRYYRCTDNRGRGTCGNAASVSEQVLRERVLEEVARVLCSDDFADELQEIVEHVLGAAGATENGVAAARRTVEALELKLRRLVDALAGGGAGSAPASVLAAIRELERQIATNRKHMVALERVASRRWLPSADEVLVRARAIGRELRAVQTPLEARERLRSVLGGPIVLMPRGDRYEVRAELLPTLHVDAAGVRGSVSIAGARWAHGTTRKLGTPLAFDVPIARAA